MVSDIGPAKRAPKPNPTRKSPVARDSVTSETPKSRDACVRAAESMEEAKPTMNPIQAIKIVANIDEDGFSLSGLAVVVVVVGIRSGHCACS